MYPLQRIVSYAMVITNKQVVTINNLNINLMSYGWLTEASILPKPAIPIHVDDSSVFDKFILDKCYEDCFTQGEIK